MEKFTDVSFLVVVIGLLATIVSVITEVTKEIGYLNRVPTALQVIVASFILTPTAFFGLAAYYGIVLEWFMIFASFLAAFVVAFVAMYGWEKLYDIYSRLKK